MIKWTIHTALLIVHCLVCLLFIILFTPNASLLDYINITFYMGAVYLMIGLLLYVISKKFFDITALSFRKVFAKVNKQKKWQSSFEEYELPSDRVNTNWVNFFSIQGGSLLVIMLILLILYY
ncbi:DUF3899 domain-containing protein [Gracilibacillus salitolerans]|uniref:DUF3899 domain-containing protein n=1 Tax=Gracilibacillus salitolerans TaxID=2663022 RepID=A0A5Q2TKZ1_9BACI|nr:DUF3899 domain-containing protein [Gracilibacillus salitolerans]QGH35629.1 DUF3899 domain-containing protein [Gracilibacillus salitolerans]